MKKNKLLIIGTILIVAIICFAATNTPWDGTSWDVDSPDIDQPIGNHYLEMQDLRKGVEARINKEHETLATGATFPGGVHKQGSARMWYLSTASIPNLQPDGSSDLDDGDNGMLWHDTTTDIIYLLDDYSDPTIGGGWLSFGDFLGDIDVGDSKFTVDSSTGKTVIMGALNLGGSGVLTIASNNITVTKAYHSIQIEDSGVSTEDNLDVINGGSTGDILIIRANSGAETVIVRETDNINLSSSTFEMDNADDAIMLIFFGGEWNEVSRSDNGA